MPPNDGHGVDGGQEALPAPIIRLCRTNREDKNGIPAVAGSRMRFRGIYLTVIGTLYPDADLRVHRIFDPSETSLDIRGNALVATQTLMDHEALFRVTLLECDAPNEASISWRSPTAPRTFTADDYCHLLQLAPDQASLGKMIMLTVRLDGFRAWCIVRQKPGKDYSLEECLDLLPSNAVVHRVIREQGFGEKVWVNDSPVPGIWMCKDLKMINVANKIRRIMRPEPQ